MDFAEKSKCSAKKIKIPEYIFLNISFPVLLASAQNI
jgi:hypothetical protein